MRYSASELRSAKGGRNVGPAGDEKKWGMLKRNEKGPESKVVGRSTKGLARRTPLTESHGKVMKHEVREITKSPIQQTSARQLFRIFGFDGPTLSFFLSLSRIV